MTFAPPVLPPSFDPAVELLLECLRSQHNSVFLSPAATAGVNWASFLSLIRKHAVRPLIHKAFETASWAAVPNDLQQYLQQFRVKTVRRNTILTLELFELLDRLREQGITAATFKGPLLAEHLYGSIGHREFVDIDIIVREKDAAHARSVLSKAGFRVPGDGVDNRDYIAQSGQISLRRPGENCGIDLHWKLSPFGITFPFSDQELWGGIQLLPMSGRMVPTLSWDHTALFLAFHGTKERWRALKWICDFSALSRRRPELNWDFLLQKAAESHSSRSLLLAVDLCRALSLPAPALPTDAEARLGGIRSVSLRTIERFAQPEPETELSIFADELAMTERPQDKARLVTSLLTTLTVSDFRATKLPKQLHYLYYLLRPFRLTVKMLGLILRRYFPRATK